MHTGDDVTTVPRPVVEDVTHPPDPGEDANDPAGAEPAGHRSLFADVEALIEDGKTYWDAELSFQKTRAAFMADSLKRTIAYGIAGAFFAMLASVGLSIGAIIALSPILTPWGATALVVAVLLLLGFILLRKSAGAWRVMTDAIQDVDDEEEPS